MLQHARDRFARRLGALILLVVFAYAAGCASPDPRPRYVTPQAESGELATLKCDWRYSVIEVDGAEVPPPPVHFFFAPGNTVKVLAGERQVGLVFDDGNQYNAWRFTYTFQPGHVYKVGAPGGFAQGVRLTDKETATSTVIR